ncbi:MAG TPA: cytochrome c oxidase subunit II [Solirubrobacteraceae bacterium]|nr:cytochrome c oxidase subunit II [Solirubrobacteraceae bacterium]
MRNRPILQMVLIGVIACAIGIPVALAIPWFPSDASKQAHNIHTLYDVLLIASVPVFVLVETVVLFSVWKFRMRPGQEEMDGPPIHGNTRLEVVWTAVPAILIVSLCTYAYTVLRSNEDSKSNEMTVNVTARQFAFEFSYPTAPGKQVVSPVLYLPEGRPVVFKLRALDVIHSFFVPNFSEKLDAVPGITTTLRVTPTRLGSYPVECTELCGAGHSLMRAAVRVVTPAAFQKWLSSQKPNGPPPIGTPPPNAVQPGVPGAASAAAGSSSSSSSSSSSASQTSAAAGKAVFTGSAGCGGCHTLAAAGTTGTVGPNLGTSIVPSAKKAGMPLKPFIEESILKPNAFIAPGYAPNVMPQTFGQTLTQTQVQALVNFISSVTK